MGFKLPSTCSPAISLDSPGSLTIKIRPLGADANSFSSLASKGSGAAAVVPLACVGVPPEVTKIGCCVTAPGTAGGATAAVCLLTR